jgi:hypothetical protein
VSVIRALLDYVESNTDLRQIIVEMARNSQAAT